ncbi:hypothetical protein AMATHDRAFT_135045 [Amanita thiersii Skay4041]|uniref:SURF1-like protein n=1 Tax=Amanita thiersii Skay4041 TaxID=703135 RepID=A0A2A9NYZ6_9AGAR|nr:hypothetical protein AMATHDRAFT_135045 [Amanita thiersii Skay4041]
MFSLRRSLARLLPTRLPKSHHVPAIYKPKKQSWFTPTIFFAAVIPFFTFGLGTWQLKRLKWKINLIDELEEKLQLSPIPLPPRVNLSALPEFVFRKVLLKGRWDHAHTMLVAPRVRDGVHGVHVVTPLIRADGSTILVDRGFISNQFASTQSFQKDEGEVQVLGMLRTAQQRNLFTPENKPDEGKWYWNDVPEMATYAGGEQASVQQVFVEQIFEGHAGEANTRVSKGIPIGRPPTVELRNSHLSYVITWYSLSALTTVMFIGLVRKRKQNPGRRLPRFI